MKQANKKARLFDIKRLPMDLSRLVWIICFPMPLFLRPKRLTVDGQPCKQTLPVGGVLVVANHTNMADPFLIGSCFWKRRMYFLAAETVMKNPVVAFLLKGVGCIRIDRNIFDVEAMKRSIAVLKKEKRVLAMFPQGHIQADGEMDKVKGGAALIAMQAGVPIVPVYTKKPAHFWKRQVAVIGEPIVCADYCAKKIPSAADMERISQVILEKMEACKARFEQVTKE